jgi:uncharacterized protein (TIGR03790 family)
MRFRIILKCVFTTYILFINCAICWALTSEQLLIVANKKMPRSIELAQYYMKRRNVPLENLIELKTSVKENISREDYEEEIASPIRKFLQKNDADEKKFGCIVLMYGIPLRVDAPKRTYEEKKRQGEERAAVDSELALVREAPYPLAGWLPNKFFIGFRGKEIRNMPQKSILVSRLDGPSEAVVRRIIDDSIEAENKGLSGKAYFDARWPEPKKKGTVSTYEFYDMAIHRAARLIEKSGKLSVVLDEQERLFQPGEALNATLYCGWYRLAHYVDAFTWVKGAVGFHIASQECQTLKSTNSRVWCKMMLEKGVAATLGPVSEPFLQAFPLPDIFFACIVDGHFTLAECYALSNPYWSWQVVLIGDPLYRPFKNSRGIVKTDDKSTDENPSHP